LAINFLYFQRMSTFYTIPIGDPFVSEFQNFQQLAQITLNTGDCLSVYWRRDERQVVLEHGSEFFIQPNARILDSLAAFLNIDPTHIVAKNLTLYESPILVQSADAETAIQFYDCEWSDYALDNMAIQFELEVNAQDAFQQRWEEANRTVVAAPVVREEVVTSH